jgi:hypothetical protein
VASSQDAKRLPEIGGFGTFGARRIGAPCGAWFPALIIISRLSDVDCLA